MLSILPPETLLLVFSFCYDSELYESIRSFVDKISRIDRYLYSVTRSKSFLNIFYFSLFATATVNRGAVHTNVECNCPGYLRCRVVGHYAELTNKGPNRRPKILDWSTLTTKYFQVALRKTKVPKKTLYNAEKSLELSRININQYENINCNEESCHEFWKIQLRWENILQLASQKTVDKHERYMRLKGAQERHKQKKHRKS
jgi:hypothetical protein